MTNVLTSFLNTNGQTWITTIHYFHQMSAHSWQFFELSKGPLTAKRRDSPLESWINKYHLFKAARIKIETAFQQRKHY